MVTDLKSYSQDCIQDHIQLILSKLVALASLFVSRYNVNHVVVSQLLFRETTRHIPVTIYNKMVVTANKTLKEMIKSTPRVHYWKLKRLKQADNLFSDGVHLSDASLEKYFRNIRGAVIHAFE